MATGCAKINPQEIDKPLALSLITVIIPNFNHAQFLQRRIDSILQQSFQDFELIMLDDASTDNSRDIMESYRSHLKVKAIHYNSHNCGSPFKQWEKGIGLANGEWIWIAEGDDYCDPHFIQALLPALTEPGCVLAYNEVRWVNEHDELLKASQPQPAQWYSGPEFLARHMMLQDHLVNSGMVMFRQSALQGLPNRWTEMKQAGDYLLWVQIAAKGKVYASGTEQAAFVRHSQSLSLQQLGTPQHLQESLEVQDWMVQHAGVSKRLQQYYFQQQLVQLRTSARHWQQAAFEAVYQFWKTEAVSRGIQLPDWRIRQQAFAAKLRHYLQQHKQKWR